ncbi:putative saga complex component [Golovinomyces cichoracearum]|uniref:Putative saga complex component n=1 Tax=Golovinomyces cichoracearum TaxID=62708 RepID=A0A420J1P4_9PEZI|nr:putative saga complex component [Golovinomyces cichoracearum]
MSAARNRAPRNGSRGAAPDALNPNELWQEVFGILKDIDKGEIKAAANRNSIIEGEERLAAKKDAGKTISVAETDAHSALFREGVRLSEQQIAKLQDISFITKLELLRDIRMSNELEAAAEASSAARGNMSRGPFIECDGPSDSPGPSSTDVRQSRKLVTSRNNSQPPKVTDDVKTTASEYNERLSRTKIVYTVGDKVAFRRKQQIKHSDGKFTEEIEWIQGKVNKVIGEGKSRRYEVRDPYYTPESNDGPEFYKSSASQMVPIPVEGSNLEVYEVGKRVLALYPDTSQFYRAEVKGTLNGGTHVQLLFEDELEGILRTVERRFTLDHKG